MGQLRLMTEPERPLARHVSLAGRTLEVTPAFWSYWHLAAERQSIFFGRLSGQSGPWTVDPILRSHRFTNAYRASDRVSQFLLHRVIYDDDRDPLDTIFRVLLFKIFNRIETWNDVVQSVGEPTLDAFDPVEYDRVLAARLADGKRLYSAAYIMPSPSRGYERKHANHLALLEELANDGTLEGLAGARSLKELYELLRTIDSFGPFLAFQYAIDLNYSAHFDFSEMDFVVAGPGAVRGIRKCFVDPSPFADEAHLIAAMADAAPRFLSTNGFQDLWGRPLQLVDVQNLFCEVDKYSRLAHPHLGSGGPKRIKQRFCPRPEAISVGYPPKWGLPWTAEAPVTVARLNPITPQTQESSP